MSVREMRAAKSVEVAGRGPVRLRTVPIDETTSQLEIGLDYALAQPPSFHYDADYCDVVQSRAGVTVGFGKLRPGGDALRNKIEIAFSVENFIRQVWRNTRKLHQTVQKLCEKTPLTPIEGLLDAEKVQCFRATTVFMAILGGESVLDFYYISPGEIHLAAKKHEIALDPVVRVVLSTSVLNELLDKAAPIATALESQVPDEDKPHE